MNDKRNCPMIPIVFLFFGVLLGAVLFKSKLIYCEGEDKDMDWCSEDKNRIKHFGCSKTSNDFEETKEGK